MSRETSVEGRDRRRTTQIGHRERDFMRPRFRFEKLTAWQDARKLKQKVYRATKSFPREEMFALTSQMRRAVTSISSNIAEGSGRNSDKDFAHFLEQAYGSLMETASLLFLAFDEMYLSEAEADSLLESADQLAGRIVSLNRSLTVNTSKTPFPRLTPRGREVVRLSTLDHRPSTGGRNARR
jgi:four helix bundle protein